MKKILVTGCNGQLGKAINQEYTKDEVEFINTDVQASDGVRALDITNVDQVLALVRQTKPDVIINVQLTQQLICVNSNGIVHIRSMQLDRGI